MCIYIYISACLISWWPVVGQLYSCRELLANYSFSRCCAKVRDTGAWSGGSPSGCRRELNMWLQRIGSLSMNFPVWAHWRTACIHADNQKGSINRHLRRKFILRIRHWVLGTMARWSLANGVGPSTVHPVPTWFVMIDVPISQSCNHPATSSNWYHDSRMVACPTF